MDLKNKHFAVFAFLQYKPLDQDTWNLYVLYKSPVFLNIDRVYKLLQESMSFNYKEFIKKKYPFILDDFIIIDESINKPIILKEIPFSVKDHSSFIVDNGEYEIKFHPTTIRSLISGEICKTLFLKDYRNIILSINYLYDRKTTFISSIKRENSLTFKDLLDLPSTIDTYKINDSILKAVFNIYEDSFDSTELELNIKTHYVVNSYNDSLDNMFKIGYITLDDELVCTFETNGYLDEDNYHVHTLRPDLFTDIKKDIFNSLKPKGSEQMNYQQLNSPLEVLTNTNKLSKCF